MIAGRAENCIELFCFNHLENIFSSSQRFQGQIGVLLFFSWDWEGDKRNDTTRIPSPHPKVKKQSYAMEELILLQMMGGFIHKLLLFILAEMVNYKCRWGLYFNGPEAQPF